MNETEFESVYYQYRGLVFHIVKKSVGAVDDTREVCQDAWMRVWKNRESFDSKRGSVKTWIRNQTKAATSAYWQRKLKKKRTAHFVAPEKLNDVVTFDDGPSYFDFSDCVDSVMGRRERLIVRDRVEGVSYKNTAENMGINYKEYWSILVRAKQKLKEFWA